MWDEEAKEWRPRWGYKRANDNTKDWCIEVPDQAGKHQATHNTPDDYLSGNLDKPGNLRNGNNVRKCAGKLQKRESSGSS